MRPTQVLIVDDEPKVALTLAASLERMGPGFTVETAYSFTDAFSKAQRTLFSLLIVAYEMPGLNGLDLARAVQRVSPTTQTALMVAYGSQALYDTARLLGLVGYLNKPFTMAQLRELVQRTLSASITPLPVLLMENKATLRRVYGNALRGAGYKVYEVTSLQEARNLLGFRRFDIFICALDVQGEHVMNMVRDQRARLTRTGTHVIAISAEGGYRSNWEDMGVDFYLETPVATGPLVTLVDRLTARGST